MDRLRQLGLLLVGLTVAAAGAIGMGCAPAIGDSCETSVDCSVNGDRICDIAQPRGYCTVRACDPDTCPGEATCVEWRFQPDRTAVTYCMKRCKSDDGCRNDYACMNESDAALLEDPSNPDSPSIARIVDLDRDPAETNFCVATEPGDM